MAEFRSHLGFERDRCLVTQLGRCDAQCPPIAAQTMSAFTPEEIAYLQSQRLGRLATVGANGQPRVVPVGFRYNPVLDTIDIGGHDFAKRKKWRDVQQNPKVAFVVDDLASVNPWTPRGIEVRGEAEVLENGGETVIPGFDREMFRIHPQRIVDWGAGRTDDVSCSLGRQAVNSLNARAAIGGI